MALRDSLPVPYEARERDPRIRGKQDIPPLRKDPVKNIDKDGQKFYFRLTSGAESSFYEFIQFWINMGKKFNGDDITFPVAAPLSADAYYWHDKKSGKRGGFPTQGDVPGCGLMALAKQHHPAIAVNRFKPTKKDGSPNFNLERLHVIPIQLVQPLKDAAGNLVYDANKVPRVDITPNGMVFEMWQGLWEQFLDILEPIPEDPTVNVVPEDDLTGGGAPGSTFVKTKPSKTLPKGTDPTTVVWSIHKAVLTDEEKKRLNNPNMKFRYVLDFSNKIVLDPKSIPPVNPALPAYTDLFPPCTPAQIREYVEKWKDMGWGGASVSGPTAVAATPQAPAGAIPPSGGASPAPAGDKQPFNEDPY